MNIFRCIAVAFSMYSRIPMPRFIWKESDMKYSLIFFPWIGIVIAAFTFLVWRLGLMYQVPGIVLVLTLGLIPLLITGGFHLDGYMDVEDARRSYADREKKLQIMKDPHIGAFAVIGLVKLLLIYGIGLSILVYRGTNEHVILYSFSFVLSRSLSGLCARFLTKAKKDGMLVEETKAGGHSIDVILIIQGIATIALMVLVEPLIACLMLAGLLLVFLYYKYMTNKEFGGVTGDTAGYFLVVAETIMLMFLALGILL